MYIHLQTLNVVVSTAAIFNAVAINDFKNV